MSLRAAVAVMRAPELVVRFVSRQRRVRLDFAVRRELACLRTIQFVQERSSLEGRGGLGLQAAVRLGRVAGRWCVRQTSVPHRMIVCQMVRLQVHLRVA